MPPRHGRATRLLHWITAPIVLAMIVAGLVMVREGIPRPLQDALFVFHKNTGLAILGLALLRIAWRAFHTPPPLPPLPAWQLRAAGMNHALLYTLLLVMPVSGYVRVRAGGFPIEALDTIGLDGLVPRSDMLAATAQTIHWYAAWALVAAVALHAAAALDHAMKRRDGVMSRMWPPF